MLGFNRKYCEIIPEQPVASSDFREIVLEIGALQSIQDIKVPKNAGGYQYRNITSNATRNRFIYWRANHDILELSEQSLDINLKNCHLRYKFAATAILSVAIYETFDQITVLATTITSVHRFDFPHPNTLVNRGEPLHTSVFSYSDSDASYKNHIAVTSNTSAVPHAAACYLTKSDGVAHFALAFPATTMVYQMNTGGVTTPIELKSSHMIPRLFCNFPSVLGRKQQDNNSGTALVFDQFDDQVVVYILHRDCNIRMWSTRTGQCLASLNILSENEEKLNVQKNMLRRSSAGLCVFLCYAKFSEFRLLKPFKSESSYAIQLTNIIPTPQYDIIDFQLTDERIWALWCNSEGDSNISTFPLNINSMTNWVSSNLEIMGGSKVDILGGDGFDPKLAYCNYIFHSGRFQAHTIFKAAMINCRNQSFIDPYQPLNVLKEKISYAIDKDVQEEITMNDTSSKDYLDISARLWEKLYFCCEQYHMEANQPIGIFAFDSIELVGIVKQNMLSFLRPCEDLENGLLTGVLPFDTQKPSKIVEDLSLLLDTLSYIEKVVPENVKTDFDTRLFRGEMPINAVQQFMLDIQQCSENLPCNLTQDVLHRIQTLNDVPLVIINLLERLKLKNNVSTMDSKRHSKFSSNIGASLVTETVRQIALIRYTLCRNLLYLQRLLMEEAILDVQSTEIIRSRCTPETTIFLQSYYVIGWICEPSTITSARRQFGKGIIQAIQFQHPMPLLQYFVKERGLDLALDLVPTLYSTTSKEWQHDLIMIANTVLSLLWPVSGPFEFGEWLSDTFQHILIEEYVRLLKSWCEWNSCSRHFILPLSFLYNGLSARALDLFLQSAKGVLTEQFLTKFILGQTFSSLSSPDALAQYYLKVIKLFEKNALYDSVIAVAQVAISASNSSGSHAMFQSILFNNHMYLNHYEEAYHTLINNCEPTRRKDCLRQLICSLIGQRRFDILLQLPLIGLESDVQNIIETRARSMPVENDLTLSHYDFLYSFHVRKGNMRKAAATMYEEAMRCTQLPVLAKSLELRYDSLLACINALHLVDKEYAFIARPVLDDYFDSNNIKDLKEVTVVDLKELRRELLITEAMMCVEDYKKNVKSLISTGPHELMELLNSEKCYTSALKLAKGLNLDLSPIFESLTLACLQASETPEELPAGDWLSRNVLTSVVKARDDQTTAWNFLQSILEEEVQTEAKYFKVVSRQILANKSFLPLWLYRAYKEKNLSELLHLYIRYGRLLEAFDLGINCLNQLLIKLHSNTQGNNYFPISDIDLLQHISAKYLNSDEELQEKSKKLNSLIKDFVESSVRQIYV